MIENLQMKQFIRFQVESSDRPGWCPVESTRVDISSRPMFFVGRNMSVAKQQVVGAERGEATDLPRRVAVSHRDPPSRQGELPPFSQADPSSKTYGTAALSHGATFCADIFCRNSSGVSLRNSQKLSSGRSRPSRPYGV
jgi:hypothetical protein